MLGICSPVTLFEVGSSAKKEAGNPGKGLPLFVVRTALSRLRRHHTDALPFCKATLQGKRCPHGPHFIRVKGYPTSPSTLGEAILKRRLDSNLRQVDAAEIIGCK